MKHIKLWRSLLFVASFGLGFPIEPTDAAIFTVQMTSALRFSPESVSIARGDTVIWTNTSTFAHTSISGSPPSGNGLWNSSIVNGNGAFNFTFTNLAPSSYPYFCSFHFSLGMTGTVIVTNALSAPSLTNPTVQNGHFQFTVSGQMGTTYVTETSEDLSHWLAVNTNVAPSNIFNLIEGLATNPVGFYRVRQAP